MKVLECGGYSGIKRIWLSVLRYVYMNGIEVEVYDPNRGKRSGGITKEISDLVVVIDRPPKYSINDIDLTSVAKKFVNNMLILPGSIQYERIVEKQLPLVLGRIRENIHTRNATFVIHFPDDLKEKYKTCSIGGQFLVRNNKISLRIFMRSCDIVNGFPANVVGYVGLLHHVAEEFSLEVDKYIQYMTSAHIYEIDFGRVEEILNSH